MESDLRARAEARLERVAADLGLADPRPPYRERLRHLRDTDAPRFDEAIRHFEQVVLPALVDGDPVAVWLDYGRVLAGADATLAIVDASGRAREYDPPIPHGALALFIPEDTAAAPIVALAPLQPSAAQQATLDLLVDRRLSLQS